MFSLKRAIIFANGNLPQPAAMGDVILAGDLLVAADGGLRLAFSMGFTPHLVIGDLDSATQDDLDHARELGIQLELFPREKDETDLELALRHVLDAGYDFIRILGGLGGRSDQSLANLLLLADPALLDVDTRLDDGLEEAFVIRGRAEIRGSPGDIVSLLPLGFQAEGIHTEGLRFPLDAETLLPYHTRGISNEMTGPLASVSVEKGLLICIHRRDSSPSSRFVGR
jgi:thiamine pyrophosphokinase